MSVIVDALSKPLLEPVEPEQRTFSKLFFGVELELAAKDISLVENSATRIAEVLGDFAIIKREESVKNGFEICTRPAPLEFHIKRWQLVFENCLDNLTISENCGMHVHISREPLSDLQIGKIAAFIHSKENYEFIRKIADRDSNEFSNYRIPLGLSIAKKENYFHLDRKTGVNLHNRKTIEIRIFKSTTDFSVFLKNLEFCDCLVRFASPGRARIQSSLSYKEFIEFARKEDYFNLINFVNN